MTEFDKDTDLRVCLKLRCQGMEEITIGNEPLSTEELAELWERATDVLQLIFLIMAAGKTSEPEGQPK